MLFFKTKINFTDFFILISLLITLPIGSLSLWTNQVFIFKQTAPQGKKECQKTQNVQSTFEFCHHSCQILKDFETISFKMGSLQSQNFQS